MSSPRALLLLIPTLFLGCSGSAAEPPQGALWGGGPRAVPVSYVELAQRDSFLLTAPRSFAVDRAGGGFLVAEPRLRRVLRFDRGGTPVRLYNTATPPGEVGHTSVVAPLPGQVVVADMVRGRLHLYDAESASLLGSVPLPGDIGTAFSQPRSGLWIGTHYRGPTEAAPQGVVVLSLPGGEQFRLDLPSEYFRLPGLKVNSGIGVVSRGEDFILGFSALESLLRISPDGTVLDTLLVPAKARRGVRERRIARHGGDTRELVNRASKLALVDQMSEGEVVLVHFDSRYLASGPLETTIYVSILSRDLRHACVDGEVQATSRQLPNAYFSADTLWIQTANVENGKPVFAATAFRLETSSCEWLPVERTSALLLP